MTDETRNDVTLNEGGAAETGEPRKISLADAMKKKLAEKKMAQGNQNQKQTHELSGNQKMKSQLTKKPNNQKKRTGV